MQIDELRSRTVGVIGAGRVGAVLASAMARTGMRVLAAHGVSDASRARAGELLPGVPLLAPVEVAKAADLLLLAVPDDALTGLIAGLARHNVFGRDVGLGRQMLVVHTSGRHGMAPMEPARAAGAQVLAMHPAMTFTGTTSDLARLAGTRFGVTCDDDDREVADALVALLGGVPVTVAEQARPLYHAGLAHGANHLVTLVTDAADLLAAAGVEDPAATLRPLLVAALDNALSRGDQALTGPVVRGDAGTLAAHLAAVATAAPDVLEVLRVLANRTADRAVAARRLRAVDAAPVLEALAGDRLTA